MKIKCKVCHRRLTTSFDANTCKRGDCPLDKGPKEEILDFKTWKKKDFKVIQEFECEDTWTNTPASRMARRWNSTTGLWEDVDDDIDPRFGWGEGFC